MHKFILPVATLLFALDAGVASAGEFIVPHQPGDQIAVHVRPGRYAHPSDYWWQRDPSSQGRWDYFTPVDHLRQPVLLEPGEESGGWNQTLRLVPELQPPEEKKNLAATIPVTNRPLR
ncbi:MAG: hypothetical protein HQM01_05770 [Magnetococcales bacterium]|nr:hypothetical protein [Magnetococcales bacterium]